MEGPQNVERLDKDNKSVAGSEKNSALFGSTDKEIDDDFLTSWKSTTLTKDASDFNCGNSPSRKKGFKFDKLDMDFGFDDGFDKISSFKLDMSDLDFSSPPRKSEIANGTPGRHSNLGKQEKKSDLFSLDFDFTNKVSFDLGECLQEEEKKSSNCVDSEEFDFSTKNHQNKDSPCNLSVSVDRTDNTESKIEAALDRKSSAKTDSLMESKLGAANDDSPSNSVYKGNEIVSQIVTSNERPVNSSPKSPTQSHVLHEYSERVELKSDSEQCFEASVKETSAQLVTDDHSLLETAQEVQSRDVALNGDVSTGQGTEFENSNKQVLSRVSTPVRSSSPLSLESSPRYSSQNCTVEIRENILGGKSLQGDMKVEGDDLTIVQSVQRRALKDIKKMPDSVPKAISPLLRKIKIGKPVLVKEINMDTFQSSPLPNSGESEGKLNAASTPNNTQPLSDDRKTQAMNLSLPELKRQKFEASHIKEGNRKINLLKSLRKPVTKDLQVAFESEEKNNDHFASSDLSNFYVQKEKKQMMHRDLGFKMTGSVDKNSALHTPSLRKKTSEESSSGSVSLNPSVQVMKSQLENPSISSELWKVLPKTEAKAFHLDNNLKNISFDHPPSTLYVPPDSSMSGLEDSSLIVADGNVEKAEACTKELEDICNMLKKKNDEAKDLLARAIVNNNLLLMLNHPIYEDKISFLSSHLFIVVVLNFYCHECTCFFLASPKLSENPEAYYQHEVPRAAFLIHLFADLFTLSLPEPLVFLSFDKAHRWQRRARPCRPSLGRPRTVITVNIMPPLVLSSVLLLAARTIRNIPVVTTLDLRLHTSRCPFSRIPRLPFSGFRPIPVSGEATSFLQTTEEPQLVAPDYRETDGWTVAPEEQAEELDEVEEEEPVYVLTDEWMEFFAKSEAKRKSEKQQKQKKGKK
ncbi:hypothetical protein H6P81_012208 [Aristolochia fimbriata]|uniref:Uncharacterized protein n=1 Tax=Aristolochia fimbriata TaxID=158543 RepID=A0AAV7ED94_ARIFI|nr:hypothetical protein H6P81_012208 [Aristolochia fimbriata]